MISPENIYGSVAQSYKGSSINDMESFINDVVFVYTYAKIKDEESREPTIDNAQLAEYEVTKLAEMVSERFQSDVNGVLETMVTKMIGDENESDFIAEIARKDQPYFMQ